MCARGWSQRPRAPERAVLGRHPSGLSPRRHGVGKKRKGERKKKATGQECHFTAVLSPQLAATGPRCSVA